jgi:hypothetical protein
LSHREGSDQPVLEPLLAGNADNIYSGFPPSFSEMLTICSTENEKGKLNLLDEFKLKTCIFSLIFVGLYT